MFILFLPVFNLRPMQTKGSYLYYCQATVLREGFSIQPITLCLAEQGCPIYSSCPFRDMQQNNTSRSCHPQEAPPGVFVINLSKYFSSDLLASGRLLITAIPSGQIQLHLFHFLRPNLGHGCATIMAVHNIN